MSGQLAGIEKPAPKVFCIGWAKTGTTSIGRALKILGYDHVGQRMDLVTELMNGNPSPVYAVSDKFDAFDDWPWILLFREMAERYPDARFLLSVRDDAKMVESYRKMLARERSHRPRIREIRKFIYGFDPALEGDRSFLRRVHEHNREVRSYFSACPHRLLEIDVARGAGWRELCDFLGTDLPDTPFPHANAAPSRRRIGTAVRRGRALARSLGRRLSGTIRAGGDDS